MSLGDYVRITRTFLEAFKDAHEDNLEDNEHMNPEIAKVSQLQSDLKACNLFSGEKRTTDVQSLDISPPACEQGD